MSACLAVSKDLLTLPFSLLLSLSMPLFSRNVGSKPPTSKSMPVCTFPSLLALPTGAFGVPQPNKLFPRWMDVSPPDKETKHSWERRQIIAYKCYLCSWGQSFCRQGFQISASSSPHHPLCISACNEWRVPPHFHAFRISTVFLWRLLQLYLSYPSLPLFHLPPHMGALWKKSLGNGATIKSSSVCKDTLMSLPQVLLGSSQLLALQHSCMTSLTSHSFHGAALLSGCLNPLVIRPLICSPHLFLSFSKHAN